VNTGHICMMRQKSKESMEMISLGGFRQVVDIGYVIQSSFMIRISIFIIY
jgi:hypothetical protein